MEIYKSDYLQLVYVKDDELIEMIWFSESTHMSDEDYKKECLAYLDAVTKFRPSKAIPDMREMQFPITLELQEWTNQTIFPVLLESGVSNVGIVMSAEIISQLAVEQTMEEVEGIKFTTRYFDDKEEAKSWILNLKS